MALIVQKYGGTSVANPERIRNVARRVANYKALGHQVVVVVSARGHKTDELVSLDLHFEAWRRDSPAMMHAALRAGNPTAAFSLLVEALKYRR